MPHLIIQTMFEVHFIAFLSTLIACLNEWLTNFPYFLWQYREFHHIFFAQLYCLKEKTWQTWHFQCTVWAPDTCNLSCKECEIYVKRILKREKQQTDFWHIKERLSLTTFSEREGVLRAAKNYFFMSCYGCEVSRCGWCRSDCQHHLAEL